MGRGIDSYQQGEVGGAVTCSTCGRQMRLHLLGQFSFTLGDATLIDGRWPRQKATAVLKLLALQPHGAIHRDRLCDLLWPELDGDAAASNLRKNLHRLRSRLNHAETLPGILNRFGALLELSPDVWIDAVAFRDAAERALTANDAVMLDDALALYAGDLLEADRHEPWTEAPRAELRALHLRTLLASAVCHERNGEPDRALARFRELLAADPLREDAHRGIMRILAARGDRAGALREYEACRAALLEDLGSAPSRATQELAREIETKPHHDAAPPPMPRVRYATTSDGVRIAWQSFGEGPALVIMPATPWSDLKYEWQWPQWRAWLQRLGRGRRIIRFDARGLGLSQRDVSDYSIEAQVRDLEAVADSARLDSFDLYVPANGGGCAVTYTGRHPHRIRKLVFAGSWSNGPEYAAALGANGLRPMMQHEYDMYCDAAGKIAAGGDADIAATVVGWLKSTPADVLLSYWESVTSADVTGLLAAITAPALVMYRGPEFLPEFRLTQDLAAALPHSRYVRIIVPEYHPVAGDIEPACAEIDAFLSESAPPKIHSTTTADGLRIAFEAAGKGRALLRASSISGSHLLFRRDYAAVRPTMQALEGRHLVVQYDGRGSGLSERSSRDFSLEARVLDIEAVVSAMPLDRFALWGGWSGGPAAIAYAAAHPERVTHLILDHVYVSGRDYYDLPAVRARAAAGAHTTEEWEFYTLSRATWEHRFSSEDFDIEERAVLLRASMDADALPRFRQASCDIDVREMVAALRMPALVICRPAPGFRQPELSDNLAAMLPNARLRILGPRTDAGEDTEWLQAVESFLGRSD